MEPLQHPEREHPRAEDGQAPFTKGGRWPSLQRLKNQTGSALLMALFTTTVLMVIATEIMYQTTVETKVSAHGINQLKAYYAARAGIELGLFRVHLFRTAVATFGDAIPDKSMLDMIWNFPFAWPPPVPEETSMVDKDMIKTSVKESLMQAEYTLFIESEGSKIDINDLGSDSTVVAESTRALLLQMFKSRIESDDDFADRYRSFDFERLLNNIADWIDENAESRNGGDEKSAYQEIRNEYIPPNGPFKTVGELHMVADMTDDLYEIIVPRITVYGSKGINVNYASKEVLQSLSAGITSEIADKIIEARSKPERGPFKNLEDFVGFLNGVGIQGNPFLDGKEEKVPLLFDPEYNFRIRAAGKSGPVVREIMALTYDFDQVKERLGEFLQKQSDKDKGTNEAAVPTPTPTPTPAPGDPGTTAGQPGAQDQKKKTKIPKERPNVVYWVEG